VYTPITHLTLIAGLRTCENHRTIDIKTQIGTKKKRTRHDEVNCKWTRKRISKTANENLNKERNVKKIKEKCNRKIRLCEPKRSKRVNKPLIYLSKATFCENTKMTPK
jgi:hypothetical protein